MRTVFIFHFQILFSSFSPPLLCPLFTNILHIFTSHTHISSLIICPSQHFSMTNFSWFRMDCMLHSILETNTSVTKTFRSTVFPRSLSEYEGFCCFVKHNLKMVGLSLLQEARWSITKGPQSRKHIFVPQPFNLTQLGTWRRPSQKEGAQVKLELNWTWRFIVDQCSNFKIAVNC